MTDLDVFKAALRAVDLLPVRAVDLPRIVGRGRRLRTRRRLGLGATGAGSLVVLATVVITALAGPPGPAVSEPAVSGPAVFGSAVSGAAASAVTRPVVRGPDGAIVHTGLWTGDAERVFFFTRVFVPARGVTIGLNAGRLGADGILHTDLLVNDVRGSDRSPGFHQISVDRGGGPGIPTFGYFAGPAAVVIGIAGTRRHAARIAGWSADPNVKIFWFDPTDLAPGAPLDGITALDPAGHSL